MIYRIIDKYYIAMMCLIALIVIWLNFHGQGMQGIIPNYLHFKRIILSGFDSKANLTFPMWGYGWLFLITENKLLLLLLQHIMALFAVWFFIGYLEKSNILTVKSIYLLKFLTVVSVPWYAFHSLMWPYSIAVSLFLISFTLFIGSFLSNEVSIKGVLLSGILFGLVLNFRSDYYMMPFGFGVIVLVFVGFNMMNIKKIAIWLFSIYVMLIPWAVYTKHAAGHYLFTSTNSGHVFFIGLGNLTDNKWGITPFDHDPAMNALLKERFGREESSLTYESDVFLKEAFKRKVKEYPAEYIKKCIFSLRSMVTGGVYPGEFFESPDCYPDCLSKFKSMQMELKSNPLQFLLNIDVYRIKFLIEVYSWLFGILVILLSFLLFPLTAIESFGRKNLYFLLILSAIIYQAAINVFAYHFAFYTSNMYIFHLVNLTYGIFKVRQSLLLKSKSLNINL